MKLIQNNVNKEDKTIHLPKINKTIHYFSDDYLNKLERYIHDSDITNQILSDFTSSLSV